MDNQSRHALVLFCLADGQRFEVTSSRFNHFAPAFSLDGRWLWFLSNDSIMIEKPMRRAWTCMQDCNGRRIWNMQGAFRGHIVVLIDARTYCTYSDGEALCEDMPRLDLATLIGKRPSAAGVWLTDGNRLADGGIARAAEQGQISLDGEWLIEGQGVTPDIDVDNPPHATFKGEDAQLAAAIRLLEERLSAKPVLAPLVTPYPRVNRN